MKQTKHTPSPWELVGREVYEGSSDNMIASIHAEGSGNPDANARLISAAPELLRELKSAIFYIETYGGDVTANYAAGGNLEQVKALLAKATDGAE